MYKKGEIIKHLLKPEWNYGLILEILGEGKVKVIFLGSGEKLLDLNYAKVEKLTNETLLEKALTRFKTKFKLDQLSKTELLKLSKTKKVEKSFKNLKKEEIVDYLMETVYI